jgi:hypothetical protein
MRAVLIGVVCVCAASATGYADQTKSFNFVYHRHYQYEPKKPEPFATGTLALTIPSVGASISASPFVSTLAYKMTANSKDDQTEWGKANDPASAYTFAYSQNAGAWTTKPKFQPDTFTDNIPSLGQVGTWSVTRSVTLQPTNGQPWQLKAELYVSCCGCNPLLNIPPPAGYANLVVSATIVWTTDGNGNVTSSDVTGFTVTQSMQVDTGNPIYAKRGDGGWDCSDNTAATPPAQAAIQCNSSYSWPCPSTTCCPITSCCPVTSCQAVPCGACHWHRGRCRIRCGCW